MTSALPATDHKSMATTLSMPSLLLSKALKSMSSRMPCLLLDATLLTMPSVMVVISTSMEFATSASTAQTGTSALLACQVPLLSTLVTDSFPFTNLSVTWPPCLDPMAARPVITASTVMVLSATKAIVPNLISREIDSSVLFATTPTSVLAAKLALQTHITRLTLL